MAYADRFGRGYLTGFNTITTVGDVTVGGALGVTGASTVAALTASGTVTTDGTLTINGDVTNLVSDFMHGLPEVTAALTNSDQRCYALYLGRAHRKITTCDVTFIVGATAGATIVYAELALATGAWVPPATGTTPGAPALTLRAGTVSDISGDLGSTNTTVTKSITPTVPIPTGTEIWTIISVDAGTQPVWRAIADDMNSRQAYKDATRPSTMAAASVFTGGIFGNAVVVPHMTLNITS